MLLPYRYVKKDSTPLAIRYAPQLKVASRFLVIAGASLFLSVIYPLISYQLLRRIRFQPKLLTPVAEYSHLIQPAVLGQESNNLTRLAQWLPNAPQTNSFSSKITDYALSIPDLKIFDARVKIGGEDLEESLIHYAGSALPGEFGNAVIFGHSVLPQFFNPENYLTIFSTLPTIEEGALIKVYFDGIEYLYEVYEMAEVEALDTSILEQHYDQSYLTLVTCVPPGTYWKRLAVRAKLKRF